MRGMDHPDFRHTPWSPERREAASVAAKARFAARKQSEGERMNLDPQWPRTDAVVPHWAARAKKKQQQWTTEDRLQLSTLWGANPRLSATEIAEIMGRDANAIYAKAHQMGLPRRRSSRPDVAKRNIKRARKATPDATGQRRFNGIEHKEGAGSKLTLAPHDPRFRAGITVFPTTVVPASMLPRLLKSGHNSSKIGKTVEKGRLRGAPIFTLTLEERATCPRSCLQWASCYGNNMHFAQRIHDDGTLTRRLWGELASLAAENKQFLVRLHVLGDFYSEDYVAFWRQSLADFPGLNVFGFTARIPPDPIGQAVAELVRDNYERCHIRFSGPRHETDCSVVIDKDAEAVGIICPAQLDAARSCASCALCWHSNRTISFRRH
jgi:hypothetical protein